MPEQPFCSRNSHFFCSNSHFFGRNSYFVVKTAILLLFSVILRKKPQGILSGAPIKGENFVNTICFDRNCILINCAYIEFIRAAGLPINIFYCQSDWNPSIRLEKFKSQIMWNLQMYTPYNLINRRGSQLRFLIVVKFCNST